MLSCTDGDSTTGGGDGDSTTGGGDGDSDNGGDSTTGDGSITDDDDSETSLPCLDEPDDVEVMLWFQTAASGHSGSGGTFSISFDDETEWYDFTLGSDSTGATNTIFLVLPPGTNISKATLKATGSDGWHIHSMSINGMPYNAVDTSDPFPKWLDEPCTGGYNCAGQYTVQRALDCHSDTASTEYSQSAVFEFTTANIRSAGSDGKVEVKFGDDCAWYGPLNNIGIDDFERNKVTTFTMDHIHESADLTRFTLRAGSTDGWAVKTVKVNGVIFPLRAATIENETLGDGAMDGVWLDKCTSPEYSGLFCGDEITFHAEGTQTANLAFKTLGVSHANSDGNFYVKFGNDDVWYGPLDNIEVDDFEKNQVTSFQLQDVHKGADLTDVTLKADTSDGWGIGSLSVNGHDFPVPQNGFWLDKPCTSMIYDGRPCYDHVQFGAPPQTATVVFKSMNVGYAGSGGNFYLKFGNDDTMYGPLNGFKRNEEKTFVFNEVYAGADLTKVTLRAETSNGWGVQSVKVNDQNFAVSKHGFWLDNPCSRDKYGDSACYEEHTLSTP